MSSDPVIQSRDPARRLIAPLWHTGLLIVLLLAISAWGMWLQLRGHPGGGIVAQHPNVIPLYLSVLAGEWGMVRFVAAGGLRRTGTRLRDVIGGAWTGWGTLMRDLALALVFWALVSGASHVLNSMLARGTAKSIDALLPHGLAESAAWIALSLSAGFCEELVFRGYLQQQFFALTGSRAVALVLQAVLFAIAHGYQGARAVLVIFVYGLLYGGLALWRRDLRPGMLAHAWTDIVGGLLLR